MIYSNFIMLCYIPTHLLNRSTNGLSIFYDNCLKSCNSLFPDGHFKKRTASSILDLILFDFWENKEWKTIISGTSRTRKLRQNVIAGITATKS